MYKRQIYTEPVTYKLMDNGVGYVRIRNFETGGGTRAVQAVDKLLEDVYKRQHKTLMTI